MRSKLTYTEIEASLVESSIGEVDESTGAFIHNDTLPPGIPERPAVSNRYSYRAAIYNRNLLNGQDYPGNIG